LASRPTVHFGYGFFRLFGIRERRFRAPAAICGPLQSAYNAIEKRASRNGEREKGIPQNE